MDFLGNLLAALIALCYRFVGSYAAAIFLFTALTKVILFPVALWTHRNGLRMVALTPELNEIKVRHYGDKDVVAEEMQALYKRRHYHPLVSTIPMFMQLVLLIGVIGAVRSLLAGTDSVLSRLPLQRGGIFLAVPVAAGLAALALGLAQNHLNPLQREQPPASQWATNGFSIALSLVLGAFVPIGVGLYWILSNLFTIPQQMLLNAVMSPKKYVDYGALERSRAELMSIEGLSAGASRQERQREKADYKKFFSVANKHLVFYSERSGFYKYFQSVIEYLLMHSNIIIHYVTSDPEDQIFELAKSQPHIRPYYIGEKRLITLMMKMDADMVVMTMPDLENFHIKRSYVRKDVEYVYMFHAMVSTHMIYRKGSFDHYDTIFCVGPHHDREIRETEQKYGLTAKRLVDVGYPLLDDLIRCYGHLKKAPGKHRILIAPSHHEGNIMDSCLNQILSEIMGQGWQVVVRPHPQYVRRNPDRIKVLQTRYAGHTDVIFETDFSGNESIYVSDVMITDWSGISMEYSFVTNRPCIFINTPMKVLNPDYAGYLAVPVQLELRDKIGVSLEPSDISGIAGLIRDMLEGRLRSREELVTFSRQYVYNIGSSDQVAGSYIIRALQDRRKKAVEGRDVRNRAGSP